MGKIMVIVYTQPSCVQCDMTKRLMDREEISYTSIDVTQDKEAYDYVVGLGYQSVPVVVAGDVHWSGFRAERIKGLKANK